MRPTVVGMLRERGVGVSTYFSPHLAEQPYFAKYSESGSLAITQEISKRILTLPMFDTMTEDDVHYVASELMDVVAQLEDEGDSGGRRQIARDSTNPPAYVDAGFESNKS